MDDALLAYFITFTTHGTWLHGDERSSIIRKDGISELLPPQERLVLYETQKLKSPPVLLNASHRKIVLDGIMKHCDVRQWKLFAVHVRSNHVHIVVRSNKSADQTVSELKTWPTRMLKKAGLTREKMWTGGGSKKHIYTEEKLREKIHYVVYEQGEMMEYYIDKAYAK
jgi:REP element-mobilizing transposase RayT